MLRPIDFLNAPCFALYRLPNTGKVYALSASRADEVVGGIDRVGEREGFFIAPYDAAKYPPLFIPAEKSARFNGATLPNELKQLSGYEESDRELYMNDFAAVHRALCLGRAMKMVLARRVRLRLVAYSLEMLRVFGAACKHYPHNYIALWHTPQTGTWLTATPELLLSMNGERRCQTMALAGTMLGNNDKALFLSGWSRKNIEEQRLVQQHIFHVLGDFGVPYQVGRLHIVPSGNLLHLRTDFSFPAPQSIALLLDLLHPTPAVCGMPVRSAKVLCAELEHIDRLYYAGYTGPVAADGTFSFFVTLRCLHVVDQGCDLYAGSGILQASTADEEWEETERKLNALRALLPLFG